MKILLAIFLLSAFDARAGSLAALRLRVDVWLTNRFPVLVARQNAYQSTHGKFFQGLVTHTITPNQTDAADVDEVADRLDRHPTDQAETWLDAIPSLNGEALAGAIKIDVYNGPTGHGWIIHVFIRFNGVIYHRAKAVGNEASFRDVAWEIYDPEQQ